MKEQMIQRQVTFRVNAEHSRRFEEFFVERYRPAMSSMPGFYSVGLLREHENPEYYQMTICFENPESAAAWRNSNLHKQLSPELKLLSTSSEVKVFDVVI